MSKLGLFGLADNRTDIWSTPQDFFDKLNAVFKFDLDVCALPENAKCERFFSPADDGLKQEWTGTCWMNPPYGRKIKPLAAEKVAELERQIQPLLFSEDVA